MTMHNTALAAPLGLRARLADDTWLMREAALSPRQPPLPPGVLMRDDVDHRPRWQPGQRLHQLFEARCDALAAAGRGAQLAVDGPAERWTYAELDAQANRLAHQLLADGVQPGERVALLFDKSAWAYAAMLAVGKVHAAYVPLDAGFPADRIGFILRDAGVRWLLSTRSHAPLLQAALASDELRADANAAAAEPAPQLRCVDALAAALAQQAAHRPTPAEAGVPASELAYVIYTSGSTGRPKGVPIDHAAIVNFVNVAAEVYGYRDDDRVYQGLTLAFDFAVEEIWVPLVVGATLLPSGSGGSLLGADLADFLRRHRATALCCVPTLLATLDEELPALRFIMVSGEACPRDLVSRWQRPGRRFLNAYGPTEATVTATLGEPQPGQPVSIGRPLPTYAIAILAPAEAPGEPARLLPPGAEGEIAIAGIGIARGYLNREAQTRAAFIADTLELPWNASGRLYRTGDLGRINAQGEVDYLGRIDTQVKIRGYRIELAEIETLLLQVPGVRQGVVNPWQAQPGVTELVAYVTAQPELGADPLQALPAQVRAHLAARLPPYMVPAYVELLTRMPMLASDKADRKALPAPTATRGQAQDAQRPRVAPQGELECAIADELAAVLGLAQVSVLDHWFDDLGANSLLLAQLASRLRARLQRPALAMRLLYSQPTVRGLAQALRAAPVAPAAGAGQGAAGPGSAPDATYAAYAAYASGGAGGVMAGSAAAPADPLHHPHSADPSWPGVAQRTPQRASTLAYWACGAAQAALAAAWLGAHAAAQWHGWHAVIDAADWAQALQRALLFSLAYALAATLLPVALKWALVGRWQVARFPVWSWRYLRFWAVKELTRRSPAALLAGTPLMNVYLRLLGARVHPGAWVGLQALPVATDLLRVDDGAVLGQHAQLPGYRVDAGVVTLGPVHIGREAVVGEGAYVDILTRIGDHGALAHASSLQAGQQIPPGEHWHGSPAQPAPEADYAPLRAADALSRHRTGASPALRRWLFSLGWLVASWGLLLPLAMLLGYALWGSGSALQVPLAAALRAAEAGPLLGWLGLLWALYLGGLAAGLAWVCTVPRALSALLRPGRLYPMYGLHYALLRVVRALSNVPAYNLLFGDSSAIVYYLRGIGQRFAQLQQTGSNFGLAQQHDVPTLCAYGSGTMVSDGLSMLNAESGARSFRVRPVALGAHSFVGNGVFVPAGHRLGDNCLLATKVMLPTQGERLQGVGLLGSPPMQIPRSVQRDRALLQAQGADDALQLPRLLAAKNRSNGWTMLGWLGLQAGLLGLLAVAWHLLYPQMPEHGGWFAALFAIGSLPLSLAWLMAVDWLSRRGRRLQPLSCSIYDRRFWWHERHWKLGLSNDQPLLNLLNGTPFKSLAWRLLGVQVGKRLFDDGCAMPEKTLVRLGDDCTLGAQCTLQGHSLEDGVFKSGRLWLGDGVTVGANAYVHYDTRLEDGCHVAPDSFVMKGEQLRAGEAWQGNPAQWTSG